MHLENMPSLHTCPVQCAVSLCRTRPILPLLRDKQLHRIWSCINSCLIKSHSVAKDDFPHDLHHHSGAVFEQDARPLLVRRIAEHFLAAHRAIKPSPNVLKADILK